MIGVRTHFKSFFKGRFQKFRFKDSIETSVLRRVPAESWAQVLAMWTCWIPGQQMAPARSVFSCVFPLYKSTSAWRLCSLSSQCWFTLTVYSSSTD